MATTISPTSTSSIPQRPLQEALVSIDRAQDQVRIYHHEVTINPTISLAADVARIGIQIDKINRQLRSERPSDKTLKQFEILSLDYDCLVDRVNCAAARLSARAPAKKPPTLRIPSSDSSVSDAPGEEFATPRGRSESSSPRLGIEENRGPSGLLEILNKPHMDEVSFDQLLASLTQETADARFFVQEPTTRHGKKGYLLATPTQIAAKGCPKNSRPSPDHNHTTTLANIIARNELGFSQSKSMLSCASSSRSKRISPLSTILFSPV